MFTLMRQAALALVLLGLFVPAATSCEPKFYATAYYCAYESEMDGEQRVNCLISGKTCTLKASFLFGGCGVAMEGIGKTGPNGDYILYEGGGGDFVSIGDDAIRERYACLGVTDFIGFGNVGLECPSQAAYSIVPGVMGVTGRPLVAWYSIAADPLVLPLGSTGNLCFHHGLTPDGAKCMAFRVDDTGYAIKGRHLDIYVGEGKSALEKWEQTGDNRYVYLHSATE